MEAILNGDYALLLDESQMAQDEKPGFVKNTKFWFKCTAVQSDDLGSFRVYFDFAKTPTNPHPNSSVVRADQTVMLSQLNFNSIANGLAHKKFGIKVEDMRPLTTGMRAQRIAF